MPKGVLTLSLPPLAVPSWSWPVQTPAALAKKLSRPALPACPGHVFRVRAQHDNRQWRMATFGTNVSLPAVVACSQVCMSVSCKCVQQSSFPVSCMHAAKFALQPSLQSSQVCCFPDPGLSCPCPASWCRQIQLMMMMRRSGILPL